MELYELIVSFLPQTEHFNYTEYPPAFEAFEAQAAPFLEALTEDKEESAASDLIDRLEQHRSSISRWKAKAHAEQEKMVLALFLAPSALRFGGAAEGFARRLSEKWNARYPKNPFFPGTYESIMNGFDSNLLGLPLRKNK